jgi:hypothetical protein
MYLGFYQTPSKDATAGELWELIIEKNEDEQLVFQIHTFIETSKGYSESWCEGWVEIKENHLFFKERLGYHWDWSEAHQDYHLLEIKDGFKAIFDHDDTKLKIAKVELFLIKNADIEVIKENFTPVKEQLNEILTLKNQYPAEFW